VKVRAHVFFGGRVQGVFFRAHTLDCAKSLGLTGWVRNNPDGRVEAVFEGEDGAVTQAIDWCSTKQPYAEVDSKEVKMSKATGEFRMFSIVP
jgi:acylphosphatase